MIASASSSCHPFRSPEARDRYLALYDARAAKWWPVESENLTVTTGWGETFVRVSGPAGAPPLVLLPGSGGNSLMYSEMVEALSGAYRTYAADAVFDVGRSVSARRMTKGSQSVEWLDGLLDALGLRDGVNLAGQSLGAALAADYALNRPERLGKVALLATAGVVSRGDPRFVFWLLLTQIPWQVTRRAGLSRILPVSARSDGRPRDLFEDYLEEISVYQACYGPRSYPLDPSFYWDDAKLRRLKTPVLFVVGEEEGAGSASKAVKRLNSVNPDIETCVIPGASHDLHYTHPDVVSQRMLEFLAK